MGRLGFINGSLTVTQVEGLSSSSLLMFDLWIGGIIFDFCVLESSAIIQ